MTTHTINVGETQIPNGLKHFVESLPKVVSVTQDDNVDIVFSRDFVHHSTLTLLATWRKSLMPGIIVKVDDNKCFAATQNMITNSGFREIIDTGHEMPSVQRRFGKLPLRPLTNRLNKDAVVQDVTSILSEGTDLIDDITPLTTILSEICENALAHSEFSSPGYVCANVSEHSQKRMMDITICDSGMGFRESYLSGTNPELVTRINSGASPIEIALQGLNSSKPKATSASILSYFGFGLYITRRLVQENRGQLCILSRNDGIFLNHLKQDTFDMPNGFPGTIVIIILDLDNPLPLEEIYKDAVDGVVPKSPTETSRPNTLNESNQKSKKAIVSNPVLSKEDAIELETNNPQTENIFALRHFGTELLTRETGLAIRAEIATLVLVEGSVTVDLDGISDITPSVADEAFGKLAEKMGLEKFKEKITFRGGTSLVNRLIDFVMKTRLK